MDIKIFQVGYVQTNCYILTMYGSRDAIIIDPGGGYQRITKYLASKGKTPSTVLLTHGHFDHFLCAKEFQNNGAKIYIHEEDRELLQEKQGLASNFGLTVESVVPDYFISDGETLNIGDFVIKVIHTPGHSKGSCCFIIEDCIFSGDTLFWNSYGRTDFYGGSMAKMTESLHKLFSLEGDYRVYPGHAQSTTLEFERHSNPIL